MLLHASYKADTIVKTEDVRSICHINALVGLVFMNVVMYKNIMKIRVEE
jgi:hypothetical protein